MYKRTKIEAEVHPRFLCLEEFMNYTGLGRGSAMKLGKEIGCVMKVGKRALYDTRKAYISGIIEREREKMDKKKDLIQMLEKIQNPNHLAMVYGFVKRMYLEEQKEREKKHE